MRYSGVVRRFTAYLVDVLVQLVMIAAIALLLEQQVYIGLLGSGFLLLGVSCCYFALMESSKYQATLGKLVVGIKVVDLAGNRISFLKATGRYFAKFLSRFLLGLGFLMSLFTKKKQCLHDKLVSTVVIES